MAAYNRQRNTVKTSGEGAARRGAAWEAGLAGGQPEFEVAEAAMSVCLTGKCYDS